MFSLLRSYQCILRRLPGQFLRCSDCGRRTVPAQPFDAELEAREDGNIDDTEPGEIDMIEDSKGNDDPPEKGVEPVDLEGNPWG